MKSPAGILAAVVALTLYAAPSFAAWPELGGVGVTVCDSSANPHFPASAPDGSGGAYFVWFDSRVTPRRFFAQHVDGSGVPLWPANGISVGSTLALGPRGSDPPVIVSDGQGGALVVWSDFRADTAGNLYAQRLSPGGSLLWGPEGKPVSLGARHEVSIVGVSDGSGGMFVAWRDDRDSTFTIRAQRVDEDGNLVWGADGVVVCGNHGSQHSPRVSADAQDGALVAWTEYRSGALHAFAQRLNAAGELQWTPLGVQLSTSPYGYFVDDIDADGTGGMIASLQDYRSQNSWPQAFAQRVSADGNVAWSADGESLSGPTYPLRETFVQGDGEGGAIVGWHEYRNNGTFGVSVQRLSSTAERQWALPGVLVATPAGGGGWERVKMVPDGADGVVFAWNADHGGENYSVYAQRVNSVGAPVWTPGGVELASLVGIVWQTVAGSDGAGGVVAGWIEANGFMSKQRLGAQRVTSEGTLSVPRTDALGPSLTCAPTPARVGQGVEFRFVPGGEAIEIFDTNGRRVESLDLRGLTSSGAVRWDARASDGRLCAPGLYFARLRRGSEKAQARVVLVE
jgi:hypothetical protein